MSANTYHWGSAIVGLLVETERLYQITTERGCDHELSDGWKFCPECGSRAWVKRRVPLFRESVELPDGTFVDTLEGFILIRAGSISIVGYSYVTTKDNPQRSMSLGQSYDVSPVMSPVEIEEFAKLKETLKDAMEKLGLWRDENFGLFSLCQATTNTGALV